MQVGEKLMMLRDDYRQRCRMEGPIEQAELDEIAWRMLQVGIQPTVGHIRAVCGGGSPNRLHPMLRNFYAGLPLRLDLAPLAADVPQALQQLWNSALAMAYEAVKSGSANTDSNS